MRFIKLNESHQWFFQQLDFAILSEFCIVEKNIALFALPVDTKMLFYDKEKYYESKLLDILQSDPVIVRNNTNISVTLLKTRENLNK